MKYSKLKKKIIKELREVPIVKIACERVGISRNTYYRWMKTDSSFRNNANEALGLGVCLVNDLAESNVIRSVQKGNMEDTKYWLNHNHDRFNKSSARYRESHRRETVVHDMEKSKAFFKRWGAYKEPESKSEDEDKKEL